MKVISHDPREYIRMLQQILASDKKRIAFLFGAGTSIACRPDAKESKVPGVIEMTKIIVDSISKPEFKIALGKIQTELESDGSKFYIEYILSSIIQKIKVIGTDKLCGLNKNKFETLKALIETKIIELVSVHKNINKFSEKLIHNDFALWIKMAQRNFPIEIFTTNYDYLFEIAFENHELPYFDGFIGSFQPFFFPNAIEDPSYFPKTTKLWKIHGSLGWKKIESTGKFCRDRYDDAKIIIYPSFSKYENSQKLPYQGFIDRLKSFLKDEDGVLITCGYSFGDQHINEAITQGLSMTKSSHTIAFIYDDFDEKSPIYKLANSESNLSIYGSMKAIIHGKLAPWKIINEPDEDELKVLNEYFEVPKDPSGKWLGEGKLKLIDFKVLTEFLSTIRGRI
jgi:hypothetical protein